MTDLPQFWVAYVSDPSDSGKIHSNFSERWRSGDMEVIAAVRRFAELTDEARYKLDCLIPPKSSLEPHNLDHQA